MTFEYDWSSGATIDRETGETLKSIFYHPHADHSTVAIFDEHGRKTFEVNFWNRSIDHAPTLNIPDDGVSRKVILNAYEVDERGRYQKVLGEHKSLTRMLDCFRRSAEGKTNYVGFEVIDRRAKWNP